MAIHVGWLQALNPTPESDRPASGQESERGEGFRQGHDRSANQPLRSPYLELIDLHHPIREHRGESEFTPQGPNHFLEGADQHVSATLQA